MIRSFNPAARFKRAIEDDQRQRAALHRKLDALTAGLKRTTDDLRQIRRATKADA